MQLILLNLAKMHYKRIKQAILAIFNVKNVSLTVKITFIAQKGSWGRFSIFEAFELFSWLLTHAVPLITIQWSFSAILNILSLTVLSQDLFYRKTKLFHWNTWGSTNFWYTCNLMEDVNLTLKRTPTENESIWNAQIWTGTINNKFLQLDSILLVLSLDGGKRHIDWTAPSLL